MYSGFERENFGGKGQVPPKQGEYESPRGTPGGQAPPRPPGSAEPKANGTTSKGKKKRPVKLLTVLAYAVFGCMSLSLLYFIWLNVQPYILAVKLMTSNALDYSLINWVLGLPLIGWLLSALSSIGAQLVGLALWAIIQFFELLPSLLTRDLDTLKGIVRGFDRMKAMPIHDSDHPFVVTLKERHNEMPVRWIKNAVLIAGCVYAIDLGLCLFTYPPIKGGMERVGLFFAAPSMSDIDIPNLMTIVVTLFAVEVIWRSWNYVRNLLKHFSEQEVTAA